MRAYPENRTFWRRVGAGIVDILVFAPLIWANAAFWEQMTHPVSRLFWFAGYATSMTLYSVAMHARYGQTFGKMLTRVKVVTTEGAPICWSHALARDCVPIAFVSFVLATKWKIAADGLNPYSPVGADMLTSLDRWVNHANEAWLYLELVTMWFNPKRRAIHDFIAGTMVVRLDLATMRAA
jgi:uncharacterized RDD family membrane protein YckC